MIPLNEKRKRESPRGRGRSPRQPSPHGPLTQAEDPGRHGTAQGPAQRELPPAERQQQRQAQEQAQLGPEDQDDEGREPDEACPPLLQPGHQGQQHCGGRAQGHSLRGGAHEPQDRPSGPSGVPVPLLAPGTTSSSRCSSGEALTPPAPQRLSWSPARGQSWLASWSSCPAFLGHLVGSFGQTLKWTPPRQPGGPRQDRPAATYPRAGPARWGAAVSSRTSGGTVRPSPSRTGRPPWPQTAASLLFVTSRVQESRRVPGRP